ncbi:hypothetical protein PG989_011708 [Apiospora arundinis]
MHRALLLPEIVAAIIKSSSGEPGYLHTCLFINRLFWEEACRILWYGCGSRYNSATAGHVTPGIRQLAEISQRSRQRAQLYANFVNILDFSEPQESWPYGDEARWHGDLGCLQFPQLQEARFSPSDEATSLNKGEVVIRYAQPSLREFGCEAGSEFSDNTLDELRTRCPKLKHLSLSSITNTLTQDGLLRFLRTFDSLQYLKMQIGTQDLWTRDTFLAVGHYAGLELLDLPVIEDEWIQGQETLFPALKYLYTDISTSGLNLLNRHVPSLVTLHARLTSPCTNLDTFARFQRLEDLVVKFDNGGSFKGAELLLIAENCPELQCIELGADDAGPHAEGLDDSMMERIAHSLPNIKEFKLCHVDMRVKPLTLRTIESLGRHCPNLKQLALSGISVDWKDGDGIISNSIWNLELELGRDETLLWPDDYDADHGDGAHASKEDIAEMAKHFAHRLPSMTFFALSGGGEGEELLNENLDDIIIERW